MVLIIKGSNTVDGDRAKTKNLHKRKYIHCHLVGWLVGLVGLVGWLVGWFSWFSWLVGWFSWFGWLVGWLV